MESFSNILFSSVVGGPSFVHSPHVPSPAKLNSCSYYLSILDPNMELPELSTKDIDDLLSESSFSKFNKDVANGNFENSFCKNDVEIVKPKSLIINSKAVSKKLESELAIPRLSDELIGSSCSSHGILLNSPCGFLFKCIVRSCKTNFSSKSEQMNHFYTEHKDKTITCASCKNIFKSKYSLQNHFLINPDCKIKNTYRCTVQNCDKYFFNQNNLEIHLSKQHSVPSISCLSFVCGLKFFDNVSRDEHVRKSHSEMTYNCSQCDKVFLGRDAFERHDSKLNRDNCSRHSGSVPLSPCSCNGRDNMSSLRRHRQLCQSNPLGNMDDKLLLGDNQSIVDGQQSVTENTEIKIMYGCPLPECSEVLNDKIEFQSHFLKHFTGELPGDINSLLPPDPPVPGLELHSKTFEANVDYMFQREETNLVQALDLVPDKLLESLEWLDDESDNCSPNSCLTSALILPSTDTNIGRNLAARNNRRRKNPYQDDNSSASNNNRYGSSRHTSDRSDNDNHTGPRQKVKYTESVNLSLPNSLLSSTGSCARTCPKVNSVMANLIKRRRVFLKERVGMMQSCDSVLYQPAARQPALKQVVHRIFNSQQLPNKYEEIVNVDSSEL